jgi:thiamine biosynthesis lipoprotein
MAVVTLARHAMATRFEMVLHGDNPTALRAAGEEALDEIERLEAQLSVFKPTSEIAHLNARAGREPVRVTPRLFRLLEWARRLNEESGGAFDITIAPLVRCWGFMGGKGRMPSEEQINEAQRCVGMPLVELDPRESTVRFSREGVMLDLGAIGKGYAIEQAAGLLQDAGVGSAFLHGGTSTIYALGHPPELDAWQVAITTPETGAAQLADTYKPEQKHPEEAANATAIVSLRDEAMSVSAVWGKCFQSDGETYGHIIDPRDGRPASRGVLAAVVLASATETDALSTALLTVGPEGHDAIAGLREGMRTLVISKTDGQLRCKSKGIKVQGTAGATN